MSELFSHLSPSYASLGSLDELLDLAHQLLNQRQPDQLCLALATLCADHVEAGMCTLSLPTLQGGWQSCSFWNDSTPPEQPPVHEPSVFSQAASPQLIQQRIEQVRRQPMASSSVMAESWLCCPLLYQQELQGVLYLEKQQGKFTTQQRSLVRFLASHAAIALFNLQLHQSFIPRSAAVEASMDGIAILQNGRYTDLNPAYATLFGYDAKELMGRSWRSIFPEIELNHLQEKVLPLLSQLGQWRGESRGVRRDGSLFDLEITLFLLEDQKLVCVCRDISVQKTTEKILEMTQFSVENNAFSIFWVQEDGRLHLFNRTAREQLGYSTEELAALSIWNVDVCSRSENWSERWQWLRSSPHQIFESHYVNKQGTVFPVEVSTNAIEFDGKPYIFIQAQNIIQRKEQEKKLLQSQKLLQLVLDTIPQKVFWKDLDSVYLGCNKLFAEIAGLSSPEEIIGLDDYLLPWGPEDTELLRSHDRRIMDNNFAEIGVVETQKAADGSQAWIETNKVPLHDDVGNVIGILGTFQDITNQKETENKLQQINEELEQRVNSRTQELQESQNFLQLIMDTIPQSIFWKDRNSVFLGCNRNFLDAIGSRRVEEVINRRDEDLQLPWRYEAAWFRECDRRVMELDEPDLQVVEPQFRADKTQGWLEISRVPLHNSEGQIIGVLGAFQDVTKRKEAEEALQQLNVQLQEAKEEADAASQAKSEFLANMSHELRTPLNGILGYAQILERSEFLSPKDRHGVSVIHECGNHLLNLINDILELAKIEARKLELHPAPINLSTLLHSVAEMCRIRAEQKGIVFRYREEEEITDSLLVDEKCLRQVLINLLGNAIKFTEEGEVSMYVKCHKNDDTNTAHIQFKVADTGVGIAPENIERLFRSFEQVGDRHKQVEGTGLGLSISQKIVQLMGGEIQVYSQPNQGSEFSFELNLPITESSSPTGQHSYLKKIRGYHGKTRRILIIDDVLENRTFIQEALESLDFEVLSAQNGQEGLLLADQFLPDLIIVDLIMPVMNGYEFLTRIRKEEKLNLIPVIVASASVSHAEKQKVLDAGADYFIGKPIDLERLLCCLQSSLSLSWKGDDDQANVTTVDSLNSKKMKTPTQMELEDIVNLVQRGRIQNVILKIQSLYAQEPLYKDFLYPLEDLAIQFKLEEIEHHLKTYLCVDESS